MHIIHVTTLRYSYNLTHLMLFVYVYLIPFDIHLLDMSQEDDWIVMQC